MVLRVSPRGNPVSEEAARTLEVYELLMHPEWITAEKIQRLCTFMTTEQAAQILIIVVERKDLTSAAALIKTHPNLEQSGVLGEVFQSAAGQGWIHFVVYFVCEEWNRKVSSHYLVDALSSAASKGHLHVVTQLMLLLRKEFSPAAIQHAHSVAQPGSGVAQYLERFMETKKSNCNLS